MSKAKQTNRDPQTNYLLPAGDPASLFGSASLGQHGLGTLMTGAALEKWCHHSCFWYVPLARMRVLSGFAEEEEEEEETPAAG